jgi:hypothetical protein
MIMSRTKIATAVVLMLLVATVAYAKIIGFAWDANTETDLAGYKMYCGSTSGGPYTFVKSVTQPITTTTNDFTTSGTYYCVLTAYDSSGNESGYSNQVMVVVDLTPPAAPKNFRLVP